MNLICDICHRSSKATKKNFPERTFRDIMKEFTKKNGTKYKRMIREPWGYICKVCVRKDVRKWQSEMKKKHGPNWLQIMKEKFKKEQFRDIKLREEAKPDGEIHRPEGQKVKERVIRRPRNDSN